MSIFRRTALPNSLQRRSKFQSCGPWLSACTRSCPYCDSFSHELVQTRSCQTRVPTPAAPNTMKRSIPNKKRESYAVIIIESLEVPAQAVVICKFLVPRPKPHEQNPRVRTKNYERAPVRSHGGRAVRRASWSSERGIELLSY